MFKNFHYLLSPQEFSQVIVSISAIKWERTTTKGKYFFNNTDTQKTWAMLRKLEYIENPST